MQKLNDPSKGRGEPGPTIESVLLREVDRCQTRLDAALEDLRRYRLSNPAPATASVYETAGFVEHRLDGSSWRRG
jgi:hypothetical protein